MAYVTHNYALGNHVYDFSVLVEGEGKKEKIPYQLSFEPNRHENITTVTLVKLFHSDKEYICHDLRKTVIVCFEDYFTKFPDDPVFFETELAYEKNAIKFLKFLRWARLYKDQYLCRVDIVDKLEQNKNVLYAYVTITKI